MKSTLITASILSILSTSSLLADASSHEELNAEIMMLKEEVRDLRTMVENMVENNDQPSSSISTDKRQSSYSENNYVLNDESYINSDEDKWYTGTSFVAGAGSEGNMIRIDQYFGHTSNSWFFGKIGVQQELVDPDTYRHQMIQDLTTLVVGIGVNALDYNNFFIDVTADYFFAIDGDDYTGKLSHNGAWINTSDPDLNNFGFGVGIGYSLGTWSIRLDYTRLISEPEFTLVDTTDPNSKFNFTDSSRDFAGLGITYWW